MLPSTTLLVKSAHADSRTFHLTDKSGPSSDLGEPKVHCNDSGMIILSINEDAYLEISPIMAMRSREQLSKAISIS